MNKSVYILLALALVCGAKLHLPALQVVAWAGMVVRYAQKASLAEAVEMTFDGDHPCPLCKVVRQAQSAERHEMTAPSVPERIQLFVEATRPWPPAFTAWPHWVGPTPACSSTPLRPPVPPPRTVA